MIAASPIELGVLFLDRSEPARALAAGYVALLLPADPTGPEVILHVEARTRHGRGGPLVRTSYVWSRHVLLATGPVLGEAETLAWYAPPSGRLYPAPGAEPALVRRAADALLALGWTVGGATSGGGPTGG